MPTVLNTQLIGMFNIRYDIIDESDERSVMCIFKPEVVRLNQDVSLDPFVLRVELFSLLLSLLLPILKIELEYEYE